MTIKSLIYFSATGHLYHGAKLLHRGYSGKGAGLNNPALQYIRNVGPIPEGDWLVGATYTSATTGPMSIRLRPVDGTALRGRSGFLIHGDNSLGNQTASEGCIIMPPDVRRYISMLTGNNLTVFSR